MDGRAEGAPPRDAHRAAQVSDWLEMADVDLDAENTIATADVRDDSMYPKYRLTGLILQARRV